MTPKHILIAEDDPVLRAAYMRRFSKTSFVMHFAENGEEAVTMINAKAPDLLICDIMMPKGDGWWVLEQLKDTRTFPVIMLTNLDDDVTHTRLKDYHVDDYLIKRDMTLHSLVETSERLLAK